MTRSHLWMVVSLVSVSACGVPDGQPSPHVVQQKSPRPVLAMTLPCVQPSHAVEMTGSVGAWKTEQIGFEVDGRVVKVLEPLEEIDGRVLERSNGRVIREGTVLAELDDERYQIAVDLANAAVDMATRRMESIRVEVEEQIPVQIKAADAEQEFAQLEFDRFTKLAVSKAVSRSQLDQASTNLKTATANTSSHRAALAAKKAEFESVLAEIQQAQQQLKDAQLDLRKTKLYSSFRGQVAQVHTVPGSYVDKGQSVLTVQMMDPIKVEVELSAAMSRRFRYGDTVRLYATNGDDETIPLEGFIYMTDPVADPQTRTFTFTLLVRNRPIRQPIPPELDGPSLARTFDVWPLRAIGEMIVGSGESVFVEEGTIREDTEGAFLWKVINRHIGEISVDTSRVLEVEKVRVTAGAQRVPFLGNWNFVPITFDDASKFDLARDLIAGELKVPDGDQDGWDGNRILFDRKGWLLQPGDLVRVDLSNGNAASGTHVPLRAIRHEFDRTYVFVVDDSRAGTPLARRVEVRLSDVSYSQRGDETLPRIEPVGDAILDAETRVIVEGAHYLIDGEPIVVVERSEVAG